MNSRIMHTFAPVLKYILFVFPLNTTVYFMVLQSFPAHCQVRWNPVLLYNLYSWPWGICICILRCIQILFWYMVYPTCNSFHNDLQKIRSAQFYSVTLWLKVYFFTLSDIHFCPPPLPHPPSKSLTFFIFWTLNISFSCNMMYFKYAELCA